MKFRGQAIPAPEPVRIKFYRGKEVIELVIAPVLDFSEFNKLLPEPKPPLVTKISSKSQFLDFNDKRYQAKFMEYVENKSNYFIIKGLEATPDLEWGTVKLSEPDTWKNVQEDLKSCFTEGEVITILESVSEANNPTEKRQKEAFDSFIATQEHLKDSLSQEEEQHGMQSGGPAND